MWKRKSSLRGAVSKPSIIAEKSELFISGCGYFPFQLKLSSLGKTSALFPSKNSLLKYTTLRPSPEPSSSENIFSTVKIKTITPMFSCIGIYWGSLSNFFLNYFYFSFNSLDSFIYAYDYIKLLN